MFKQITQSAVNIKTAHIFKNRGVGAGGF